ncbi:hypothetical protein MFRU_012g02490 [Monilinia fructicola]|nr:hypothetical protein MFRU_012g02490 [Monilinia fructicola]
MKAAFALLALATSTLAQGLQERWYSNPPGYSSPPVETDTTTWTTFTSTTICPVTSTTTEKGTTKWVTTIATSTVVVTSCVGGCGGVVTVPGPTGWETTTTDVVVTYTTTCPVEETITAPGTTYTKTYTTTSVVETVVPTTIVHTVTGPPHTTAVQTEVIETVTSLCPITDTTTISGKEVTVTYTTTSYYTTHVPTHVQVTTTAPDKTETAITGVYSTITSLCPVTDTTTISGKEVIVTYTTTSYYTTHVPTHVEVTTTAPGKTETAITGVYSTITSLCPVTETKTISGSVATVTYTTTSYIVTKIGTTVEASVTLPPKTTTVETGVLQTITSLCPVTETQTISGIVYTVTKTTTSLIVTHGYTTEYSKTTLPPQTQTVETGVLQTITSLCPVTEIQTISGVTYTVTKTSTSLIVTHGYTTDYSQTTLPPQTQTVETEVLQTITSLCPVTEIQTISGVIYTVTKTSTSLIVTHGYYTDYSQTTLPPQTKTIETYAYQTSTALYPITQVQTVSGIPITKVYTSTIYTEVKVPTTIVQYTTTQATEYKTTDVYETTTCVENVYTTVSAGSTIVLTATETNTIKVTSVHTLTSTLPAATGKVTVYVPTTIGNTIETVDIVTVPSVVTTVTIPTTYWANTTHAQTSTYIQPSTLTVGGETTSYYVQSTTEVTSGVSMSSVSATPSAPIEANAAGKNGVVMGAIVGLMGLLVLF